MAIPIGAGVPRLNMVPVFNAISNVLNEIDFRSIVKVPLDCIDSSPFINVSLVSLKSLPFLAFSQNPLVEQFDNRLSVGMRYLESGVMSTASLVHNFFCGLFFSLASMVTFGQAQMLTDQMRKHWIHTGLAAVSLGVSAVGAISPEHGAKANVAAAIGIANLVLRSTQINGVSKLGEAYQRNNQVLKNAVLEGLGGNQQVFQQSFVPLFNYLDTHLNSSVQSFSDLGDIADGINTTVPGLAPAFLRMIVNQLQTSLVGG